MKYFHVALAWLCIGFIGGNYVGYRFYESIHPVPMPPVPPGPGPGPIPEPINNAPINLPGFSVLILYESSDLSKYPKEQANIIYDQSIRQLLDSVCSTEQGNNTKQYRVWDKDVVVTDSQPWKEAMARPHDSIPWIIISNGKTGTEEALPKNSQQCKDLINKFKIAA